MQKPKETESEEDSGDSGSTRSDSPSSLPTADEDPFKTPRTEGTTNREKLLNAFKDDESDGPVEAGTRSMGSRLPPSKLPPLITVTEVRGQPRRDEEGDEEDDGRTRASKLNSSRRRDEDGDEGRQRGRLDKKESSKRREENEEEDERREIPSRRRRDEDDYDEDRRGSPTKSKSSRRRRYEEEEEDTRRETPSKSISSPSRERRTEDVDTDDWNSKSPQPSPSRKQKKDDRNDEAPIPKPLTPKPKKSPAKRQSFLSNFGIRKNVEDVSDDSDHAPVSPSTKRTSSMAKNKKWSISRPPKPQQPDLESSINELNAASLAARLYERRRSLHPPDHVIDISSEDLREIRDLELEAATAAWMVAREKKKDPFVFHEKRDPMRPFRRLWYMLMTKGAHDGEHLRRSPTEGVPPEVLQNETVESDQTLFGAVKGLETRKEFEERWRIARREWRRMRMEERHEVYVELDDDEEYDRDEQGKIRNVLDQTGPEGETLLHVAMLYQKDEIAKFLMDRRPSLINRTYEGYNYFGESPCHIAVVHNKMGMLRRLIAKGADVHNPRATGKFFKPSGTLYFGETVLAFAACMGHVDIVHYLIEKVGVDPNQIDHQGNNVLHVLAFWGYFNDTRGRSPSREEYRTYHKHSELGGIYLYLAEAGADDTLANLSGMTPLQVAVWRGHVEMVNAMLNKKRQCMWTFGKASSWMYDLSEIDTFVDPVMMNHTNGAMEIAIQQKNRDVLNLPLFQRLLEAKWISYGRRMFYFNFIRSFIYYLLLTACIYFVPNGYDYYSSLIPDRSRIDYFNTGAIGIVRLVIEIALVASNVYTAADELESMRKLKMDYFTGPGARENMSQWLNLGFMGVAIAARIARNSDVENIFLGFHAMLGWISMMNYSVGFQQLGTLWLIFIKIVTGDLVRFIVLLSVFIIGFGEALWLQMGPYASYYYHMNRGDGSTTPTTTAMITPSPTSGFSNASDDTVATTVGAVATATAAVVGAMFTEAVNSTESSESTWSGDDYNSGIDDWRYMYLAFVWAFRILMQQGDYDDYRNPRNSWFSMILFMVLFFTLMILLLNVFLALLNQTFSKIMEDTEKQWRMIKAQLILSLDEAMLGEYYDDLRNGKDEPSPVCRIGFPRPQQNFMSDGRLRAHHEKAANIQPPWYKRMFMRKSTEIIKREFFKYYIIFEVRDDRDLPMRMIASTDPKSPLSGRVNVQSFSDKSWDPELLERLENDGREEPVKGRRKSTRRKAVLKKKE